MSRAEDIAKVELELKGLEVEANQIQQNYQSYHMEVAEAVKEILVQAKVWDEIHSMETEREETKKKTEAAINKIREKAGDLVKVRQYLVGLEVKGAPPTVKAAEVLVDVPVEPVYPPLVEESAPESSIEEPSEPPVVEAVEVAPVVPRARPRPPRIPGL